MGTLLPELSDAETLQVEITAVVSLRPVVADFGVCCTMPATAENHSFACREIGQEGPLLVVHHHGFAHGTAIVFGKQSMYDLCVGILDDIRNQLGRNLVRNDEAGTVLAHFGQHVGK